MKLGAGHPLDPRCNLKLGAGHPDLLNPRLTRSLRGTVVERWSLTGELSLFCARPTADG